MDLLRKLRSLLGALAHKPFAPGPAPQPPPCRSGGDGGGDATDQHKEASTSPDRSASQQQGSEVSERERVADLIAQQRLVPERSKGRETQG